MNLHLRDLFLCLDENTLLYIKHSNDMKSLVLAVNEIFCWFIVINTFKDVTIMFTGKNCQTYASGCCSMDLQDKLPQSVFDHIHLFLVSIYTANWYVEKFHWYD